MKKITLIGSGSMVFTRRIVHDLIHHSRDVFTISLVDTDKKALELSLQMANEMIKHYSSEHKVEASIDRKEVLCNSDYVVTMISVGGRRAWEQDVLIPRKYGIFQPVGDSVMPGGISRAMRMIPAMMDIARDVEKLAPNARLLNFANPMAMICKALFDENLPLSAGLCHGIPETLKQVASIFDISADQITANYIGLNHLTFIHSLRHGKRDLLQDLPDCIKEIRNRGFDLASIEWNNQPFEKGHYTEPRLKDPLMWDLFDRFGCILAPGDRHISEYYYDRFTEKKSYFGHTLGIDAYPFEKTILAGDRDYEKFSRGEWICGLEDGGEENEHLISLINSIEQNEGRVFPANIRNNGFAPDFPVGAVLEVPVYTDCQGLRPIEQAVIPSIIVPQLSKHLSIVDLASKAARFGDKNLWLEAILLGGYMHNTQNASEMIDELISVHKEFLPQF